jgi:phosphate transport system protein
MAQELRRDFHDRIAQVRAKSIAIIDTAVGATQAATEALIGAEVGVELLAAEADNAIAQVREVEAEVFTLLALEAPVARDLRMILTSRDISQRGELCLGLCLTMIRGASHVRGLLTAGLRSRASEVGTRTASLLRQANSAWRVIDPDLAEVVIVAAAESRQLQRAFFAELVGLREVPVDAAVDLGMALRAYERLIDHSVDIATRVIFTATGMPPGEAGQLT